MTELVSHNQRARGGQTLRRLLIVVALAVLLGVIPYLSGLVGSLILYVITRGFHRKLASVIPARVSAFAITLAVFALLVGPGTWLISTIVAEASDAARSWRSADA